MDKHKWIDSITQVHPCIFKILTPTGDGTGFQLRYSPKNKLCGIATAYHVVQHAYEWEEPIKIFHSESQKMTVLRPEGRAILPNIDKDLALIIFPRGEIPISELSLELVPSGKYVLQGVDVAWLGFPVMGGIEPCFFAGHISCYLKEKASYLVDGVAINGVSGGPVFFQELSSGTQKTKILGVITGYIANTSTGVTLPGVSYVRDVEPYQARIKEFDSFVDAQESAEQEAEKIKTKPSP